MFIYTIEDIIKYSIIAFIAIVFIVILIYEIVNEKLCKHKETKIEKIKFRNYTICKNCNKNFGETK